MLVICIGSYSKIFKKNFNMMLVLYLLMTYFERNEYLFHFKNHVKKLYVLFFVTKGVIVNHTRTYNSYFRCSFSYFSLSLVTTYVSNLDINLSSYFKSLIVVAKVGNLSLYFRSGFRLSIIITK